MFENYSISEIKKWISDYKILFATNSTFLPGTAFLSSLKTYIDYIPIHNITFIPGIKDNKPFYGMNVFLDLIAKCLTNKIYKKFDYIIYIDEDAFICDFKALLNEFEKFMKNDSYCIAGPQDGSVFCHRNHSYIMINTFISFWNVRLLRETTNPQKFIEIINRINKVPKNSYLEFRKIMRAENSILYDKIIVNAEYNAKKIADFRNERFPDGETPYAGVVKNDPNNPVEPHQNPYSFKTPDEESHNFEPYYLIEQAYIIATGKPIMYFFATDYYDRNLTDDETDNSGLTSAVYSSNNEHKLIAVHTWFARAYTRWPTTEVQMNHTIRINKIIKNFGKL